MTEPTPDGVTNEGLPYYECKDLDGVEALLRKVYEARGIPWEEDDE